MRTELIKTTKEYKINDVEKATDLLIDIRIAEIDANEIYPVTHDPRDGRPWPPFGVPIWVWDEGEFSLAKVAGAPGRTIDCQTISLWEHWDYIRPPWPENKNYQSWNVIDSGNTIFSKSIDLIPGDRWKSGHILHVELRGKPEQVLPE